MLNLLMILLVAMIILCFFGGFRLHIYGHYYFSSHRILPLISYLTIVIALQLWLIAPGGLNWRDKIDYWLNKWEKRLRSWLDSQNTRYRWLQLGFQRVFGVSIQNSQLSLNHTRIVFSLMVFLTIGLFLSPALRYYHFGIIPDLGIFVSSMDNAVIGGMFENHIHFRMFHPHAWMQNNFEGTMSMFASHFRPILFFVLPLYKLFQTPYTLFLIQAIIVGTSVWPIYRVSNSFLKKQDYAIIICFCYCIYPSIIGTSFSFFPSAFVISFLMWAFWFNIQKKHFAVVMMMCLTLMTKESMALPVFSFGLYLIFFENMRKLGAFFCVFSIFYLLVCLKVIIPFFGNGADYQYLSSLYGGLGQTMTEIIMALIFKPWLIFEYLFTSSTCKYLIGLLFPLAFLPLRKLGVWFINFPILAQNILAGNPGMDIGIRNSAGLWSAPLIPFIFMALVLGFHKILKRTPNTELKYMMVIIVFSSLISLSFASRHAYLPNPIVKKAMVKFYQTVPLQKTVSTNLQPETNPLRFEYHFKPFPNGYTSAEYIFIGMPLAYHLKNNPLHVKHPAKKKKAISHSQLVEYQYLNKIKNDRRFGLVWELVDFENQYLILLLKRSDGL